MFSSWNTFPSNFSRGVFRGVLSWTSENTPGNVTWVGYKNLATLQHTSGGCYLGLGRTFKNPATFEHTSINCTHETKSRPNNSFAAGKSTTSKMIGQIETAVSLRRVPRPWPPPWPNSGRRDCPCRHGCLGHRQQQTRKWQKRGACLTFKQYLKLNTCTECLVLGMRLLYFYISYNDAHGENLATFGP